MTNLPLLPGHRFSDPYKINYHKTQQFVLKSTTCVGIIHIKSRKTKPK